jgi:hypothetical protein
MKAHQKARPVRGPSRINDLVIHRLDELLPWNWAATMERRKMAA